MEPPLFSILIPSRNRLELLRHAVDSVLSQSADFEIVIADNASQEPYGDYIATLGQAVKYVRSEVSLPVTENWNLALNAATGRYVIMMGDDDALSPGWLQKATALIHQFDNPDVLYAMAYHYAYPAVVPSKPDGYLATVNNSELFRKFDLPYILPRSDALRVGRQALRFRHWFSFNSQHFVWSRRFIDSTARTAPFFQGPYPDYYAAIVTMMSATKIVVVPTAEVIIGISPKSFGFFYNNEDFNAGQKMLGNVGPEDRWTQVLADDVRAAVSFPGAVHYRNWLIAALLAARHLDLVLEQEVDLRRYRRLQMLEIFSGHYDRTLGVLERFELLKPHLQDLELRLWRQLRWLERVSQRLPSGKALVHNTAGLLSAIYTRAIVTEHDVGEHSSIADAVHWLTVKGLREPKMEPLTATADGTTIAVVYLARSADGSVADFEQFISSYRTHDAGIPHDLVVIRKGLDSRYGSHAALATMLDGITHRVVDISDDGYDIQAYLRVTPMLRHDRVCFLNTFSEIKADGWLRKLNAPLDEAGVGITGATASYESLYSSLFLLSKVIWLTAVRDIQYSPRIAAQYREVLLKQSPVWMNKRGSRWRRIKRELARPLLGKPFDTTEINAAFETHWDAVTQPGAAIYPFRDVKPFPNPHLRSNAFMIRRNVLLGLDFQLEDTKPASNRFESAPDGLPARLAGLGMSPRLVGADGTAYAVDDWPKSRTFRLGDQANVLVADNQVRAFDAMTEWEKKLHVRLTWGDYVVESAHGLVDFGVKFGRGNLMLDPPPIGAAAVQQHALANEPPLLFSIVIPTHNRLALLRDAVDSVLRQTEGNWECIVFDNASEEPILDFIESLADPRIRCVRSHEFLPVTASWNCAIDLATGDYITLIGDDDGLIPNYFVKLAGIASRFGNPNVIYSSLYQFFHPTVAPWQRAGYVVDLRNGFFFQNQAEPFILNSSAAEKAVIGSLTLHRNFTYNMQAFAFSRHFLNKVRFDGAIFHSPFPDYYLANMAMGMAETIAISPEPLAVAGVSRASFGYTLFNNLEEKGAAMLNAKLREDPLYAACEPHLLPGPAYNTNFVITMEHVVQKLGSRVPTKVDYGRYRRKQIFAMITAQDKLTWMRMPPGSLLWAKLSASERKWAIYVGFLNWRVKSGHAGSKPAIDAIDLDLQAPGFPPIQSKMVIGRFAKLPELFKALEAGTYAPEA